MENIEKKLIVPDTEENRRNCPCPDCPAYNKCMNDGNEVLYCSKGKSQCEFEKWGCLCSRCPVHSKYQLVGLFYCEKGADYK